MTQNVDKGYVVVMVRVPHLVQAVNVSQAAIRMHIMTSFRLRLLFFNWNPVSTSPWILAYTCYIPNYFHTWSLPCDLKAIVALSAAADKTCVKVSNTRTIMRYANPPNVMKRRV